MAVQIEKDGWKVSGSTLEELELGIAAVQRALSPRTPGRPRGRTAAKKAAERKKQEDWKETALRVLKVIAKNEGGANVDELVESLSLKSRRSVGSPLVLTNKLLRKCQFDPKNVYVKSIKNGTAYWYPRAKIHEAVQAIAAMEL